MKLKCSSEHPTGMVLGEVWQMLLQELRARQPGIIAGEDAEELHRFRVALRKTRALLRLFRAYLPESATLARELAWLSAALNSARDLDIITQFIQRTADRSLPNERRALVVCLRELERERAIQHKALQALLRGRRYQRLLKAWQQYIARCQGESDLLYTPIATSQRVIAIKQMLQLLRRLRHVDARCPPARLHRLRIRCKRLRYLFEALPAADENKYVRLRKTLAQLQGILGEHQDAVVIRAWCDRFSERAARHPALPMTWFVAVEQQQQRARAALPSALHALLEACADI